MAKWEEHEGLVDYPVVTSAHDKYDAPTGDVDYYDEPYINSALKFPNGDFWQNRFKSFARKNPTEFKYSKKKNKWIFQSTCEKDECEVNSFHDFIEYWFIDEEVFEDIAWFLSCSLKPRKFTHTVIGDREDGYNSDFIVYEYWSKSDD